MSHPQFREWIKTPKGKLTLALSGLLLSWVFLLLNYSGSLMVALPSETRKTEIRQEIRKFRSELNTLKEKKLQAENQKKRWKALTVQSWQPERDGDPELLLRQKIESAAKKSELKLNTLGTVRLTRINMDFAFAELDISATAKLAPLTAFVREIETENPHIAWRRFSVYSTIRRPRPGNSRTVSANTQEDELNFSGNLRMLVYSPESGDKNVSIGRNGKTRNYSPDAESGMNVPPGYGPGGPRMPGGPRS